MATVKRGLIPLACIVRKIFAFDGHLKAERSWAFDTFDRGVQCSRGSSFLKDFLKILSLRILSTRFCYRKYPPRDILKFFGGLDYFFLKIS